ncbi:MAG: GNAT family N-acetyltransferase, partial [Betaproteobacteria bacterium]
MQAPHPTKHRFRIELVAEHQHASLVDLLCELHAFYDQGATPPRQVVMEHLRQNLLAPGSAQRLLVASRSDGVVVGLAAFSLVYSLVEFAED